MPNGIPRARTRARSATLQSMTMEAHITDEGGHAHDPSAAGDRRRRRPSGGRRDIPSALTAGSFVYDDGATQVFEADGATTYVEHGRETRGRWHVDDKGRFVCSGPRATRRVTTSDGSWRVGTSSACASLSCREARASTVGIGERQGMHGTELSSVTSATSTFANFSIPLSELCAGLNADISSGNRLQHGFDVGRWYGLRIKAEDHGRSTRPRRRFKTRQPQRQTGRISLQRLRLDR